MTRAYVYFFAPSLAAMTLALLLPAVVSAQAVPSSVLPSHIEEQLRTKPVEPPSPPTPFIPRIQENQPAAPEAHAPAFMLRDVHIEHSTVYPFHTLRAAYEHEIGKRITLAEAQGIAARITARYRKDGYVLSQAVIPAQDLAGGVLHIRVVEGFIDNIIIENDHPERDRRHLIQAYAEKIKKDRPLNICTLERYMLLITDLPGVSAQSILRPSASTLGAADLVISVHNKAVDANITSDNRGNKYLGPYQEQMALSLNSLAGWGERTSVTGINTLPESEMHFWSIQHEELIGSEGTRIALFASSVKTHPGDILAPLDIKGLSEEFSATVTHPFLRARESNLTGRVAFDAHNTQNNGLGETLNADRVRAARIGMNYNINDAWNGFNLADFSFSKGLAWPGATDNGTGRTRSMGEQEFTKSNISLTRLQNLPAGLSLLAQMDGQFTNVPLLQSEQMTLGGTNFGRAYDAGEIAGDSGIAGKAELRFTHALNSTWLNSYQLYGYYDAGTLFVKDAAAGSDAQLSLASAGAGVRFNLVNNIYGYTEAAFPLTRTVASEHNTSPRLFFSLSAQF